MSTLFNTLFVFGCIFEKTFMDYFKVFGCIITQTLITVKITEKTNISTYKIEVFE